MHIDSSVSNLALVYCPSIQTVHLILEMLKLSTTSETLFKQKVSNVKNLMGNMSTKKPKFDLWNHLVIPNKL